MIRIGCTTFDEHQYLSGRKKTTLFEYASYFSVVELDTSYYFVPQKAHVEKWLSQVPANFRFIMKMPKIVTGQEVLADQVLLQEIADAFKEALAPMTATNQLFCILAQFPASFKCTKKNVDYLTELRHLFHDMPIAIEFRDNSWYEPKVIQQMHDFMTRHHFSLVVVDEAKKLSYTPPFDSYVTNKDFAFMRVHGRNDSGWAMTGPEAKKYRTLYNYSETELLELNTAALSIAKQTKELAIIFNNNAGGDAAENALQLERMLNVEQTQLNPRQLGLFE